MTEVEKIDIKLFLKLVGEIDSSQCMFTDVPDALIPYKGATLGIEHTRLYQEDPTLSPAAQLLPQEKLHWRIAERARQIFHEHSNQLLLLYVTFSEPYNYRQRDLEEVAQVLAQSVLVVASRFQTANANSSLIEIGSWQAKRLNIPYPVGVSHYDFTIVQKPGFELWGPAYGYMVPELSIQRISNAVCEKEARIEHYRARCDKIWLLIVTDTGMPSSHFRIPDDLDQHLFTTSFDRLFLLWVVHEHLAELRIQHSA